MDRHHYENHGKLLMGITAGALATAAVVGFSATPANRRQVKRAANKAVKRVNEAVDHLTEAIDL